MLAAIPSYLTPAEQIEVLTMLLWVAVVVGTTGILILNRMACPDPSVHPKARKAKPQDAYCPVGRKQQGECPHCLSKQDPPKDEP